MATQVSLNSGAVASAGALAIQTNGTTQAVSISTGQVATLAQNPILTSGIANGVAYLNGSKVLTTGSALTFNGSALAVTGAVNATASSGSVSTLRQNSATGYGLTIIPGADTVYDAFTINNAADSLNKIRMYGNGTAYFAGNLSVGGATPTTSGTGITFPATQSASSDANTLDDYEEGTFTPQMTDATNNATMGASNSGTYTKIGRVVTCSMYVETTSLGSIAAGAGLFISGWPYTIAKTGGGFLTSASGLNITANQVVVLSPWAGTLMRFYIWDATTGTSPLIASQWSADGASYISITYTV